MPRSSMTSARNPAGAPDEERRPEDVPRPEPRDEHPGGDRNAPGAVDEEAARVDSDLDALLADVKRERDEYLEIAQRARADFENYRRRAARETQEAERRGKAALARELLPALDNLERALRSAGLDPDGDVSAAQEGLARGVALVYGELRSALERAGVETYDATGETFDPTLHEALSTRAGVDGVEPGTVIETLERGYRLDGQVLRAARVVVSA
jgi:molecular chaperone GrpE